VLAFWLRQSILNGMKERQKINIDKIIIEQIKPLAQKLEKKPGEAITLLLKRSLDIIEAKGLDYFLDIKK
jgi:hypothetical protein